jgi:endonuclease/exonuclease/phosphatase family metal-dependent hydrolase
MDRRVRPGRIVDVLGEIDADIIALQEVLRTDGWNREFDQARFTLHVFNVHFGTAFFEHREQARRLFDDRIVSDDELIGSRIVLGDFNEWLPGPVSKTLRSHLECADIRRHLQRSRTYPGMLPLLHLDHIYFDRALKLEALHLHKQRNAIIASDHLPLAADFRLERSSRSLPLQVGLPVRAPMLHG